MSSKHKFCFIFTQTQKLSTAYCPLSTATVYSSTLGRLYTLFSVLCSSCTV